LPDLEHYDAIVVGTGTRFGRISSQMAAFLDQAGGLLARGALNGKVGAAFSPRARRSTAGRRSTLFSVITNLLHFGMTIVGLDYGHQGQMRHDEVVGGAPYGATTIAGGDGSRQPSETELEGARDLGARVADDGGEAVRLITLRQRLRLPPPHLTLREKWGGPAAILRFCNVVHYLAQPR